MPEHIVALAHISYSIYGYMSITSRKEAIILFLGDFLVFDIALSLMLFIRYGGNISDQLLYNHIISFSILFAVSSLVYFISGLYEKHTIILKSKLSGILFNAQIINTVIAVTFFYLIPYFGIAPKTNLFLYLVFSLILMLVWRLRLAEMITKGSKQNALLVGGGDEMHELLNEVNNNNRYDLHFMSSIDVEKMESLDFQDEILNRVYSEKVGVIAVDVRNEKVVPILPKLYNLIFSHVHFIDMYKIYEEIFDRVPLSLVQHSWFLENISLSPKVVYDGLKRAMDLIVSGVLFVISLVFYPFIFLAIRLDDGGDIFYSQDRVGQNNHVFKIRKFRSMAENESGKLAVTRVGKFLRKTRLDELPQLWNVLRGDLSLIGPRPEMPHYVDLYTKEIPYYNIRHLIKPGLSGWAQLYQKEPPKFSTELVQTRNKLSYDLYYVKNRSFMLDVKIGLKTLKTLISTSGV